MRHESVSHVPRQTRMTGLQSLWKTCTVKKLHGFQNFYLFFCTGIKSCFNSIFHEVFEVPYMFVSKVTEKILRS